jgi:aspartate carbamoyltransferase catalytic subunit
MTTHGWDRRHLLALEGVGKEDLVELVDAAEVCRDAVVGHAPPTGELAGRIVANLFFEDSTRTRTSFTIAAQRLGAKTISLTGRGSSLSKGESLIDTVLNIDAMGVDAIIIRCDSSGALVPIADRVQCPLINAGDGRHEHPTQGLLDLMTLRERLGDLEGRRVAIVGDIRGSRVARSNVHALTTMGADVVLVGPAALVPRTFESIVRGPGTVRVSHDLDAELEGIDAIMMLRVQLERGTGISDDYGSLYGLTAERAARLPAAAPVLHPGPINRGLEIVDAVADDPARSVILHQVTNGVAVRMAVLKTLVAAEAAVSS